MKYFDIERVKSDSEMNMTYMHNHEYYELYFLISGKKLFITQSSLIKLSKNTLIIARPYELHKFEGGPYDRILVAISKEYLSVPQCQFLDALGADATSLYFNDKAMKKIDFALTRLMAIYGEIGKANRENQDVPISLYFGYLLLLIELCGKKIRNEPSENKSLKAVPLTPTILKVIDFLKEHFNEKITIKQLCQKFHLSKTWLSTCFYEATGSSIMSYKITLQVNHAKKLLHSTDLSFTQIAEECGFSSTNYFGIMFKRYTGMSPREFRHIEISNI